MRGALHPRPEIREESREAHEGGLGTLDLRLENGHERLMRGV